MCCARGPCCTVPVVEGCRWRRSWSVLAAQEGGVDRPIIAYWGATMRTECHCNCWHASGAGRNVSVQVDVSEGSLLASRREQEVHRCAWRWSAVGQGKNQVSTLARHRSAGGGRASMSFGDYTTCLVLRKCSELKSSGEVFSADMTWSVVGHRKMFGLAAVCPAQQGRTPHGTSRWLEHLIGHRPRVLSAHDSTPAPSPPSITSNLHRLHYLGNHVFTRLRSSLRIVPIQQRGGWLWLRPTANTSATISEACQASSNVAVSSQASALSASWDLTDQAKRSREKWHHKPAGTTAQRLSRPARWVQYLLLFCVGQAGSMVNYIPQLSVSQAAASRMIRLATLPFEKSEAGDPRVLSTLFPINMHKIEFSHPSPTPVWSTIGKPVLSVRSGIENFTVIWRYNVMPRFSTAYTN